jgi:hypothetical protein
VILSQSAPNVWSTVITPDLAVSMGWLFVVFGWKHG